MNSQLFGRTVNKEYYQKYLRNLHEAIRRKPQHLDFSPRHCGIYLIDYLTVLGETNHPCNVFLLTKPKRTPKRQCFSIIVAIQLKSLTESNTNSRGVGLIFLKLKIALAITYNVKGELFWRGCDRRWRLNKCFLKNLKLFRYSSIKYHVSIP